MLEILNCGINEFRKCCVNKKVYIYGAGKALENCLNVYFREKSVELIIDKNSSNWGKTAQHCGQSVEIRGIDSLISCINTDCAKDEAVLFISSPVYASEIVEQLDAIPELDGVRTYVLPLIRNTYEPIENYDFTKGDNRIPKTIHYIWFGQKELPYEFQKNIETWTKLNPDYEIVRWDESNYNIEANPYVKKAYEMSEYSFASNYARFDIVYNNGGIYLDTDVEVIANFDVLLRDKAFFNMGSVDKINTGCGFGSIKEDKLIHDILLEYEDLMTNLGTKQIDKANHLILHKVLCAYGFQIDNKYQCIDGHILYPCDVMSPLLMIPGINYVDERTVSIHKEAGTWRKDVANNVQSGVEKLLQRIE